jgi:molybdate transport system substrate-binding protein
VDIVRVRKGLVACVAPARAGDSIGGVRRRGAAARAGVLIATYPIAALEDAGDPALAKKWVDLVMSSEGQKVLAKWNFEPAAR